MEVFGCGCWSFGRVEVIGFEWLSEGGMRSKGIPALEGLKLRGGGVLWGGGGLSGPLEYLVVFAKEELSVVIRDEGIDHK